MHSAVESLQLVAQSLSGFLEFGFVADQDAFANWEMFRIRKIVSVSGITARKRFAQLRSRQRIVGGCGSARREQPIENFQPMRIVRTARSARYGLLGGKDFRLVRTEQRSDEVIQTLELRGVPES
jgi:hypothetical protein